MEYKKFLELSKEEAAVYANEKYLMVAKIIDELENSFLDLVNFIDDLPRKTEFEFLNKLKKAEESIQAFNSYLRCK